MPDSFPLRRSLLLLFCLLVQVRLFGQSGIEATPTGEIPPILFKVNDIKFQDDINQIRLFINALDQNGNPINKDQLVLNIYEEGNDSSDRASVEILDSRNPTSDDLGFERPTVLFLLDKSGSMCAKTGDADKMVEAKNVIYNALGTYDLDENRTYFAAFHDYVEPSRRLTLQNYGEVVEPVDPCERPPVTDPYERRYFDTDLFYAIHSKLEELKTLEGQRKVLFLLTDGWNDNDKNPRYLNENNQKTTFEQVLANAGQLAENIEIRAVGFGNPRSNSQSRGLDEQFLKTLVQTTPSGKDRYARATLPGEIGDTVMAQLSEIVNNFYIDIRPEDCEFAGEQRQLIISYNYGGSSGLIRYPYRFGTEAHKLSVCNEDQANYLWIGAIGLIVILLLFFVLTRIVPLFGFLRFQRRYVKKYARYKEETGKQNVAHTDPITRRHIGPNELIVTKCPHIMTLRSWQSNGNQCHMHKAGKCKEGIGRYRPPGNFFRQLGMNRLFNWIWFGAIAGFFGWLVLVGFKQVPMEGIQEFLASNLDSTEDVGKVSDTLLLQILFGFSLASMLAILLSFVEETGEGGRFNIGRMLFRAFIGAVISIPIFFLEELALIFFGLHDVPVLGPLIGWLIFGTALGLVMTIDSSIQLKQGFWAGVIASVAAYLIYLLVQWLIPNNVELENLLSYIAFGGVLGAFIISTVDQLEDFELIVWAPSAFKDRKIPISKWLKSPAYDRIFIGNDPGLRVLVKWEDEGVAGKHAALTYDNKRVCIEPVDGQVKINSEIIKGKTPLKHEDIISLGREGKTKFQFRAKMKSEEHPTGPAGPMEPNTPARKTPLSDEEAKNLIVIRKVKKN